MPKSKPKRPKPSTREVAERIAERLFDSWLGEADRLALMVKVVPSSTVAGYAEKDCGGWGKDSVIRIITEELTRKTNP